MRVDSLCLPQEFERQQWEIIRLWDTCNVSLLHRTYFFLFFKGDPADSIYMEVELRRLFFLQRVLTEGGFDQSLAQNGLKITPASWYLYRLLEIIPNLTTRLSFQKKCKYKNYSKPQFCSYPNLFCSYLLRYP